MKRTIKVEIEGEIVDPHRDKYQRERRALLSALMNKEELAKFFRVSELEVKRTIKVEIEGEIVDPHRDKYQRERRALLSALMNKEELAKFFRVSELEDIALYLCLAPLEDVQAMLQDELCELIEKHHFEQAYKKS